jgi:hypothetical protein
MPRPARPAWILNRAEVPPSCALPPPVSRVSLRKGKPSLASLGPHPSDTECQAGSLLQVAMATPALGFPDLDSGEFVFQSFPVHQRLAPAGASQPPSPRKASWEGHCGTAWVLEISASQTQRNKG